MEQILKCNKYENIKNTEIKMMVKLRLNKLSKITIASMHSQTDVTTI